MRIINLFSRSKNLRTKYSNVDKGKFYFDFCYIFVPGFTQTILLDKRLTVNSLSSGSEALAAAPRLQRALPNPVGYGHERAIFERITAFAKQL